MGVTAVEVFKDDLCSLLLDELLWCIIGTDNTPPVKLFSLADLYTFLLPLSNKGLLIGAEARKQVQQQLTEWVRLAVLIQVPQRWVPAHHGDPLFC